ELSNKRAAAAKQLDRSVAAELPALKLEKAVFATRLDALDEAQWGEHGAERVSFEVATNPGTPPGPINRIASGGELARFMLALKVVVANSGTAATLVFDEVDSGVGGAVAAAVGERLSRLGEGRQVLVITHSPQVAARGASHLRIIKEGKEPTDTVVTLVDTLDATARREEIARMLSGKRITDEARAAADSLLQSA
ncbi:MAG: DNA repair protein RecN, partial [Alphaproteobacteria bacterium]|nr:DNA repair protein RecN [Alphaproteobacteria bacterium]